MRVGLAFLAALVLARVAALHAAGPLLVNGAGVPLVWPVDPVPFNPDRGPLGALDNATAVGLVAARFAVWSAVSTADIHFVNAGALPVDVTALNVNNYLGVCGDGLSPIIFDTDGQITEAYFGQGASNDVLGFAAPDCVDYTPPEVLEGVAVLNGKWIDGIDTPSNPELPLAEFEAVFVHEFGHYVNLDHSQINLLEAFDGSVSNNDAVATMFPILVSGTEGATPSLDDRVALSTLYPAASFGSGFGTITGTILRPDGTTPFQGAYVIARRVDDPRIQAVGAVSGMRYVPGAPGGPTPPGLQGLYELPGLPPGTYAVEIEAVDARFTGGSGVGPLDPPAVLPGLREFYSGASEAGTNPPDDPGLAVPVVVGAGQTRTGIDVVINALAAPPNDECTTATPIPALPFAAALDTRGATTAPTDPLQSCAFAGPNQDSNSVWYVFTATQDMTVTADTMGSDYDTVLTAYVGSCGALTEIGCNDDMPGSVDSRAGFSVHAGETIYLEVAGYDVTGGGQLALHVQGGAGCATVPDPTCNQAARGRFRLIRDVAGGQDRLMWRWRSGPVTVPGTFGDPTATTDYALCVYDETNGNPALRLVATVPAGGTCGLQECWSAKLGRFRYANPDASGGLQRVILREGTRGPSMVTIRGGGAGLVLPPLPLTQDPRVTVQFVNDAGGCWDVHYSAPAGRNVTGQFVDRAD